MNLLIGLFLILSSCCEINYIDPPEVNNPVMDSLPYNLIWEVPLFEDTSESFSPLFPPVLIGENVIYASDILDEENPEYGKDYIIAYDKLTGNIKWVWSGYKLDRKKEKSTPQVYGNIIVVTSGKEIYGINSETGAEEFSRITEGYRSVIQVSKGILFYSEEFYPDGYSSSIFMYNNSDNTWREEFKVDQEDIYKYVNLYPPEVEINQNNDTILYFQERKSKRNENFTNSSLFCYNLTKDSLIWKIDSVDSLVSNISNPPLVDDEKVYFLTAKTFHCYDKYTGEKLWERYFEDTNFLSAGYGFYKDVIYVVDDRLNLIEVYRDSGEVKYYNNLYISHLFTVPPVYKNYILTVFKNLDIINADTGRKLHSFRSHRFVDGGVFNTGVAVDPNTNYMYVPDGYFLNCIEFPE